MLERSTLLNITLFMERVQCTGKEAMAWAETYAAVSREIQRLDAEPMNRQLAEAVEAAKVEERKKHVKTEEEK